MRADGKPVPAMVAAVKPRLRGVVHEYAFFVALAAGAVLLVVAPSPKARLATAIYVLGLAGLLGTSALYHRVTWRKPNVRRWLRRLDHSMIFVLIAGTYTPFAVLVLSQPLGTVVLVLIWTGAAGGIVLSLLWPDAPRPVSAGIYVAVGWVAVIAMPQLFDRLGGLGITMIALGGLLYSIGAVVYARKRPDPYPTVFGYHEIFHVLVVAAAALHFAVIAFLVLPLAA
ncbi:MAG TPA: hemolysin III family protein [Solirubrobacteraceae bacterium]|nr:hemolysin III family protein [Solirubrobacteraceae bacterium]